MKWSSTFLSPSLGAYVIQNTILGGGDGFLEKNKAKGGKENEENCIKSGF